MIVKNVLLMIVLSIIAIYFQTELMAVLKFLMYVHAELAKGLGVIFTVNAVGEVVQSVIALLLIPAVIGVLFATAHYFIRQHHFPHTIAFVWVCWAVLLAAVLSQTGRVSDDHMGPSHEQAPPAAVGPNGTPVNSAPKKVGMQGLPSPANTQQMAVHSSAPSAPNSAPHALN